MTSYYLEYEIIRNRPGLLGDITSLMGLLNVNISMVNGVSGDWRGFLLEGSPTKMEALEQALQQIDNICITALRSPEPLDVVKVKHGVRLEAVEKKPLTFRFLREQLGLMIDFLGELLQSTSKVVIAIRGTPHVGKTEAAIAGCVYAKKRWILLSSTIIRQTIRTNLLEEEQAESCVYLVDGITSASRGSDQHWELLRQLFQRSVPVIIEHPDVFMRDGKIPDLQIDYVFELRNQPEDEIRSELVASSFHAFDIS